LVLDSKNPCLNLGDLLWLNAKWVEIRKLKFTNG